MTLGKTFYGLGIVSIIILSACGGTPEYSPKPRCFPRVEFPEKSYMDFSAPYCDLTFEFPEYGRIEKDEKFFEEDAPGDCWFDVVLPEFNGKIHCSYAPIDNSTENYSYEKYVSDAFKLAEQHSSRADYIDTYPYNKSSDMQGMIFNIEGAAASPFQFYMTDSVNHFLRGSVYFNTQAQPDSLMPVIEFVKADAVHMMNTLSWE